MSNDGMTHSRDAKQLAEINKTEPIWEAETPRWLLKMLQSKGIENNTFRINKVSSINKVTLNDYEYNTMSNDNVEYHHQPLEIELASIETLVKIPSKVYDIMNYPHNQMATQLRLTINNLYENQENYFINDPNYGLIVQCTKNKKILHYGTNINPDMLDDLLGMVWNKPTFYLMHPSALVEFCKSCTARKLITQQTEYFGYQFVTWRGLPIVTSDKIPYINNAKSYVFLIRTGYEDSGVIQLYNMTPTKSGHPGIFVETSMTDNLGTVSTRVSLYTNIAILSKEAIACATWTMQNK